MAIDLVDKQGVIEAFNCEINITGKKNAEAVVDAIKGIADRIKALPVIESRAKGYWIDGFKRQRCSNCRYPGFKSWKFCPSCGADMRKEEQ